MKGRKPKLEVIEGGATQGRCPMAPDWMPVHAQREWNRVAPELHSRNLLAPDTMATLESYCLAFSVVRELQEVTVKARDLFGGLTKEGMQASKMMFAAMRESRLLAAELGLTLHRRGAADKPKSKENGDGWDSDLLA